MKNIILEFDGRIKYVNCISKNDYICNILSNKIYINCMKCNI